MRKRNVMLVRGIIPLTHANGVITLRGSEMCALAWTPSTIVTRK